MTLEGAQYGVPSVCFVLMEKEQVHHKSSGLSASSDIFCRFAGVGPDGHTSEI